MVHNIFIRPIIFKPFLFIDQVVVSNRRMMRSMFTEYFSPILFKYSLISFPQNRVKWLLLASTHMQPTKSKPNRLNQSLQTIFHLTSFRKIVRTKWPPIYYTFYCRNWLKYPNRQWHSHHPSSFHYALSHLLYQIIQYSRLLLQYLVIYTLQFTILCYFVIFLNTLITFVF